MTREVVQKKGPFSSLLLLRGLATRVGHAYAEYANDADYAHMRNMRMRMRIENLIHIIHI